METHIMRMEGDLTVLRVGPFKQAIAGALADNGVRTLAMDLQKVPYMDSSALGVLVWAYKRLQERGGRLQLHGVQPRVQAILDVTRLSRVIEIVQELPRSR